MSAPSPWQVILLLALIAVVTLIVVTIVKLTQRGRRYRHDGRQRDGKR